MQITPFQAAVNALAFLLIGIFAGVGLVLLLAQQPADSSGQDQDLNPQRNDLYGLVTMTSGDCMPKACEDGEECESTCNVQALEATVYVYPSEQADKPLFQTQTNSKTGAYRVNNLSDGTYTVIVRDKTGQILEGPTSFSVDGADVQLNLGIDNAVW